MRPVRSRVRYVETQRMHPLMGCACWCIILSFGLGLLVWVGMFLLVALAA